MRERLLAAAAIGLLIAGCAALMLTFVPPASAQEAPAVAGCTTVQSVLAELDKNHEKYVFIDTTSLIGVATDGVGKILVSTLNGAVVFGVETPEGCMKGPIALGKAEAGA